MNAIKKLIIVAAAAAGGLTAAGTGWAYWSAHGSGTATATVGTWKTDTTTAVVSSGSPSLVGQQVTYTATVTPAKPGTPTGKVAFFDGASAISSCGGATGVALSGSSAACAQTYAAAGSHSIRAQYLGDANFNLSPVSATFTQVVNQASTSASLSVAGSPAFYGSENTVVFTAAVSSSSGTPTGTVAIEQGTNTLCSITVPGASTCSPGATALPASSTAYTITAVYSGDANFSGSTSPAQSLTIDKANATITWPTPTAITYGTALSATQLNAKANIPGTFTYSPAAGTILNAGSQPLTLTFNPTDTTNYVATPAGVTILVNKAGQTVSFTSTAPSPGIYNTTYTPAATATSGLSVTFTSATTSVCTVNSGTVTFTSGTGTCTINADQAGNGNYNAATQTHQNITLGKANQTVTFTSTAPTTARVGDTYTPTATASSGLVVTYSSTTPSICTVSIGIFSFAATGTCTVQASQSGDTNYNPATQSQSITVYSPLTITTVVRDSGNKKVDLKGTGGVPGGGTVTVTICKADAWPCSAGNLAGTATASTVLSDGTWMTGQSSSNLSNSTTYFARAAQGTASSLTLSFTVTGL